MSAAGNKAYYERNRERLSARQAERYDANREALLAQRRARRADPDTGAAVRAADREKHRKWAAAHPDEAKARNRKRTERMILLRRGLTPESFESMLQQQNRACAICRGPFIKKPHIDHDHATGKVRGLLCHPCNVAIGMFRDDPERMMRAAEYVTRHANPTIDPFVASRTRGEA